MKTRLSTFVTHLFLLITISLISCSKVRNEQPAPLDEIPDAVARILTDAYPNATDVTLKTVEKDKEWEARFSQGELQYYVTMNPSKILAAHKLISATVPDSIKKFFEVIPVLSPNKGVLSDFRQILNPNASDVNYSARFTVDQKDYLLTFRTYNQPSDDYDVTITEYYKFSYYDLNDQITNYLLKNNYANVFAKIRVLDDNKKRYIAWTNHLSGPSGDLIFDDATRLIVSYLKEKDVNNLADFPESIQKFIINSGLTLSDQNYKFSENGVSGYHVFLLGIVGVRGYRYSIDFDQDGKMIAFSLNVSIVHNRK